ncbi:MAG: alpha/beta hydrolase, partial [Hyphomicrobium sp.]
MLEWPASNLPVAAVTALMAAVGVLLYVFAWRAVREMPLAARIMARLVLAVVVLLPFCLLIQMKVARQGEIAGRAPVETPAEPPVVSGRPAAEPAPEARPRGKSGEEIDAEMAARQAAQRRAEDAEREARAAAEQAENARKKSAAAKPARPSAAGDGADKAVESSGGEVMGRTRGLSPPAPAAPAPAPAPPASPPPAPPAADASKEGAWDVVPVFFGTDRAVQADPKRLQFSWERGRKLSLGRALVTVPRAHQVPTVERPWVVKIPYFQVKIYEQAEDPKKHFTMQEIKALTKDAMLAAVRERLALSARFKDHALIFVHGYNTGFDNAVYRTAQIAYDLKFDGAPFLYSWPSGGAVASYTYDRESAGQSEPHLRQFLEMVVKETGAKSVSVIAHSMGNQPLLQVLKELKLQAPAGVVINQVISAAPDVDRDNFENVARTIQGFAKGVTLYAASNDRALIVSRRFHGGVPRAGDVPEQGPVVLPGVDTIDV